jgi:D-Tyr-tRNAtyr deacylase
LSIEYEEGRKMLFQFIEDHPEYTIFSDPDLDGIFAASLTARALGSDILRIQYPKPSEIDSLKVTKSILIELPLSKGLTYVGHNILIDHHYSAPFIALYNGSNKTKEVLFNSGLRSVSKLMLKVLREILEIDENGLNVLEAIDQIDSGNIESELADKINKAFLLNSMNEDTRKELTLIIYRMGWNSFLEWVEKELSKWNIVESKVEKLNSSVKRIEGSIMYFTYNALDQLEAAARRMLMFKLEKDYDGIVLSIGLRKGKPVSATIATKGGLDLNKFYLELRKNNGVRAGGRKNIGGIQFKLDIGLDEALTMIQKAVEQSLGN